MALNKWQIVGMINLIAVAISLREAHTFKSSHESSGSLFFSTSEFYSFPPAFALWNLFCYRRSFFSPHAFLAPLPPPEFWLLLTPLCLPLWLPLAPYFLAPPILSSYLLPPLCQRVSQRSSSLVLQQFHLFNDNLEISGFDYIIRF